MLLCGLVSGTAGCKKKGPPAPEKPVASASPAPVVSSTPSARPRGETRPAGPRQVVLPGQGITAIRFGATIETIERHMRAACDIRVGDPKAVSRCVYVKQAVDFSMEKGELVRAKVHLRDRLVPGYPDQAFGAFYGGMKPDILLGLHRHVVHEELGKPERSETVGDGKSLGLVARDYYPGVTLEYDLIDNGNTVLAAMEVYPIVPSPVGVVAGSGGGGGKTLSSGSGAKAPATAGAVPAGQP